jgi:hypothetical protein
MSTDDTFDLDFGMSDERGDTVRPATAQFKVKEEGVYACRSVEFEPYTSKAGNRRAWLRLQLTEKGSEHLFITTNMGLPTKGDTSTAARLQLGEIAGFFKSAGISIEKLRKKKGFNAKAFTDKVVYCHFKPGSANSYSETAWISEDQYLALKPVFANRTPATGVTASTAQESDEGGDLLDGI